MVNWYAVHGTSMNNTNQYISGDNKGYAEQVGFVSVTVRLDHECPMCEYASDLNQLKNGKLSPNN